MQPEPEPEPEPALPEPRFPVSIFHSPPPAAAAAPAFGAVFDAVARAPHSVAGTMSIHPAVSASIREREARAEASAAASAGCAGLPASAAAPDAEAAAAHRESGRAPATAAAGFETGSGMMPPQRAKLNISADEVYNSLPATQQQLFRLSLIANAGIE